MIDQMRVLATRCKQDGVAANQILLELLSESHFAHMQTDDLRYGAWLNAAPVRPACAAEGIVDAARQQSAENQTKIRAPRPVIYAERVDHRELVVARHEEVRELAILGRG
jgi:hypothetical protein